MADENPKGASAPDQEIILSAIPEDSVGRWLADRVIARLGVIEDVIALHTKERCEDTDELDEVGYMLREIQQWLREGKVL
jgi:hypothetical protein